MLSSSTRLNLAACSILASSFLAACGGGSSSPPAPVAQATLVAAASNTAIKTGQTTSLSASGGSGTGAVSFAVTAGGCAISGTTLSAPSTASTCTVTASKAADSAYLVATSAPITINVSAVTALTFASAYSAADADTVNYSRAGRSVEGGAFNWYQDSAAGGSDWSNFWWNGVSPITDNPPSFYFGLGFTSATTVPYIGAFVKAPNDGAVTLDGQTKLKIAVWGNAELTGRKVPTFRVFIQAKESYQGGACFLEAEAGSLLTPTSIDAQTYTLNLSDFKVKNNCTGSNVTSAAEILAKPIGAIHVQVLKANMYFSGTALSPNGINVGPISFQP